MTDYFAVIDDDGLRRGPFKTLGEAGRFLKKTSAHRGHTDEEARQFFLHGSAVVMVETANGREELINIGWLAREKSGGKTYHPDEPVEALQNKFPKIEAHVASLIFLLIVLFLAVGIAEMLGKIDQ